MAQEIVKAMISGRPSLSSGTRANIVDEHEVAKKSNDASILVEEDDDHTLTGYGDISMSKEDFLPSLPSNIPDRSRVDSPKHSRSSKVIPEICSSTPKSPASEFAAFPNYIALVARIRKIKDGGLRWNEAAPAPQKPVRPAPPCRRYQGVGEGAIAYKGGGTRLRFDQRTTSMSVARSSSRHSESRKSEREGATDGDWQLVDPECWWRTAFTSVSWSFTPEDDSCGQRVASPPYLSLPSSSPAPRSHADTEDNISLNPDLVGFKLAEAAVSPYEKNVGFNYAPFPTIEPEDLGLPPPLNLSFSEEDVIASRDRWRESVEDLLSSDSEGSMSSSMTESTRSDHSADFFAMPATPDSKATYANVLKNLSPGSSVTDEHSTSPPPKALNAFASSFVPSAEASSLSSFTFPTLNPPDNSTARLTTVKIRKDDQGFFTDVQVEDTPQPLPSFLQEPSPRRRTRTSKTREIVDRLRSSQADNLAKCISHSPSPIFHDLSFIQPRLSVSEDGGDRDRESSLSTPSLDEEDDGWYDLGVGVEVPASTKAKRARDLFLALTRRRTNSTSSEPPASEDKAAVKPKAAPSSSDGWIEGHPSNEFPPLPSKPSAKAPPSNPAPNPPPSKPQRKKHHAPKSSTSSSIMSVSPTYPAFAAQTPYMSVPMMRPPHLPAMMPAPAPGPMNFFFNPTATPFIPLPPYTVAPPTYLAPSPFAPAVPVPLHAHPMPAAYAPKAKTNTHYQSHYMQPAALKVSSTAASTRHGTFGKSG